MTCGLQMFDIFFILQQQTAMLSSTLCWFLGALLLTGGMLASLYLTWLQARRRVTGFSLLATSDALATVAISITFLLNVSDNHNDTGRTAMVCVYCIQHISNLQNETISYMNIIRWVTIW